MIDLICSALYQLGYGFTLDHTPGLLPAILSSLRQQGYQSITVIAHTLDYSAKTEAWTDMYHNIDIISCQMKPILIKLGLINEELFDRLYQQTMIDLQMDAFCGIGHVTTIIGQKPEAE